MNPTPKTPLSEHFGYPWIETVDISLPVSVLSSPPLLYESIPFQFSCTGPLRNAFVPCTFARPEPTASKLPLLAAYLPVHYHSHPGAEVVPILVRRACVARKVTRNLVLCLLRLSPRTCYAFDFIDDYANESLLILLGHLAYLGKDFIHLLGTLSSWTGWFRS